MSLIQRIERAQQEHAKQENAADAAVSTTPVASTDIAVPTDVPTTAIERVDPLPAVEAIATDAVPVMDADANGLHAARVSAGAGLRAAPAPAREDMIRAVRMRMQTEIVGAFKALLEAKDGEVRARSSRWWTGSIASGGFAVTRDGAARLVEEMIHDVTGFGPLEPYLADPTITEVMVNGPDHIYIERRGKIERVDSVFLNDEHVLRVIERIITPLGRRIDESSPRVDARLPDGSRVNAIIAPLSLVGPVITVRKFSQTPYTVDDLDPVRDGDARDVRVPPTRASRPASTSSCRAARARARRRPSTSSRRSSRTTSAS